jgi:hypothetical protein
MAVSCGGGSSTTDPGAVCLKNSDCKSPLTCSFGRCMEACAEVRDCPAGQQCVKNASGINSCLLPEVEKCNYTSQCASPLVCAADFACRNQCQADRDCATSTQKCVLPDRVCAEPAAIDTTTGKLKNIPIDGGAVALDGGGGDISVVDANVPDAGIDLPLAIDSTSPVDTKPAIPDAPASGPEVSAVTDGGSACSVDAAGLTLPGSVAVDTTLTYRAGCTYKVTTNITIGTAATLTIEPGVRVEFASGAGLEVDGALNAVGTAALPIVFAGAQPTAGYWDGIYFYRTIDNRNVLDHVIVDGAGNTAMLSGVPANVALDRSSAQITNTSLRNGKGFGLALAGASSLAGASGFAGNTVTSNALGAASLAGDVVGQLAGAGSTFVGNAKNIIAVASHTVLAAQTWPALDVPYLVNGVITVQADLAIAANANLRFATTGAITVSATGSLAAVGTAGKEVTFVGDQATTGYWAGILYYTSNNTKNVLDHVIVENAGTTYYSSSDPLASLEINKSRIQLKNSIIRNGSGHGLTLVSATVDAFAGNQFTSNTLGAVNVAASQVGLLASTGTANAFTGNGSDFVVVRGETVNAAVTWPALDVPYLVTTDTTLTADTVIAAGAKLVFKAGTQLEISSSGSLVAVGTAAAPVVFTCEKQLAGCWNGLLWYSALNPISKLDYVTVSYGGGKAYSASFSPANITVHNSTLSVTNSTIANSGSYGMFWDSGATVTQSGNTFTGNVTADTP